MSCFAPALYAISYRGCDAVRSEHVRASPESKGEMYRGKFWVAVFSGGILSNRRTGRAARPALATARSGWSACRGHRVLERAWVERAWRGRDAGLACDPSASLRRPMQGLHGNMRREGNTLKI
eukprot:gene318-biopygen12100